MGPVGIVQVSKVVKAKRSWNGGSIDISVQTMKGFAWDSHYLE